MYQGMPPSRWTWSATSPGRGGSSRAGRRKVTVMAGSDIRAGHAMPALRLDPEVVRQARELAATAGQPIVEMARTHTTVSVERAVLRLGGLDGAADDGMPWVNHLVDAVKQECGLDHGVALPAWDALLTGRYPSLAEL